MQESKDYNNTTSARLCERACHQKYISIERQNAFFLLNRKMWCVELSIREREVAVVPG